MEFVLDQRRDLDEQMHARAQDDAVDQPVNPVTRREEQRADDLADVVQGGRHGWKQEMLVGLQAGHDQSADGKDDRGDKVQAHQFSAAGRCSGPNPGAMPI